MIKVPDYFKRPDQLISLLGIEEPNEIDLEAIAEHCRATIVYRPLTGCDARILGRGDRAIITVNKNSLRERQRFSAGHELGHWMHDRGKVSLACAEKEFQRGWDELSPERAANRFSADLLMPREMFKRYALNKQITFDAVTDLAKNFSCSKTATAIRLVELGSRPAAIVCTENGQRKWTSRNSLVPWELKISDRPASGALALKALSEDRGKVLIEDVDADLWIDHPNSSEYILHEESVRVYDDLVLTLLWWKNEKQILDLDDE